MRNKKTDNSCLSEKLKIRQDVIDATGQDRVRVLDCYAGKGIIWNLLKNKNQDKEISVLSIEKEKGKNPNALCGDNLKILPSLDLSKFDVIDIDAYGLPFEQTKLILESPFRGWIVITFIQSQYGRLNKKMVESVGLSWSNYNKCSTLFKPFALPFFFDFLSKKGIDKAFGYFLGDKNYFYINKSK